jgi:putative ABC transport system ATP-binding protein
MNLLGCLDTPRLEHIFLMARMLVKKDDELAEIRNKEIGFVFQTLIYCLVPALANVALPMIYAGYSKSERTARAAEGAS